MNINIEKMTSDVFAPFGDLIDTAGEPTKLINNGLCQRFNDRVRLDFDGRGRAGVSVLYGQPYALPYTFNLVERHPLGSQAFIPNLEEYLYESPWASQPPGGRVVPKLAEAG